MRQIKFRGKNSKDEWVYGSLIINEAENEKGRFQVAFIVPGLPCASDGDRYYTAYMERVKVETVGQFTGLHDKDGREIYEGDIVTMMRAPEGRRSSVLTRHVIETDTVCRWHFRSLTKEVLDILMSFTNFDSYRFSVIGNIHDTPELAHEESLPKPEPKRRRHGNGVRFEIVTGSGKMSTNISQAAAQSLIDSLNH